GVEREVSLVMTPEAKVGDYVIVHAGFAIQILDRQAAEETRLIFDRMAQAVQERRQRAKRKTG
ncbi:MAG: HypC/HybG/HupF family hydrogenase formation chaperone, partial [candidate division WOR-3 bacterium]